jgi:hypothetical protein
MEWLFAPWEFMSLLASPSGYHYQGYVEERRTTITGMGRPAELSAVEMWVLRLSYEDVADHLDCGRCGARLGRKLLSLLPSDAYPPSVRMLAMTRCSGWRRHLHVAVVTESSKELLLGPLRLKEWSRRRSEA